LKYGKNELNASPIKELSYKKEGFLPPPWCPLIEK